MNIISRFVNSVSPSTTVLSTVDLIEHMAAHHQDEALALVELARWHQQQADALAAERRALAADVTRVLRQAEAVLR